MNNLKPSNKYEIHAPLREQFRDPSSGKLETLSGDKKRVQGDILQNLGHIH